MCGIIGIYAKESDLRNVSKLEIALEKLRHRGPNSQSLEVTEIDNATIVLGHARLSVIDLTSEAGQPMTTLDGRYSIVFNGEIYNHLELRGLLKNAGYLFKTHSDTEVLLAAWAKWGEACLDRLIGMFAFTILDHKIKTLTFIRDCFGIKPLFICKKESYLYFASELQALIALRGCGARINMQRSYDYLAHGDYDSNEETFVDGVTQLPPGCIQVLNIVTGSLSLPRHWWKPSAVQSSTLTFKQASTRLRELFLENIRLHLRSDVPLGAALSGGIDSSAVVCAIRYLEPNLPINTFSYIANNPALSEERWVDLVNQRVGAKAHKVTTESHDLLDDLDDMIVSQGEPFASTSIYAQYRVFQLAKKNGVTVTLDGQGADELLGGYSGYPGKRIRSLLAEGNFNGASKFLGSWSQWPGRSMAHAVKLTGAEFLTGSLYQHARDLFSGTNTKEWIKDNVLTDGGVNLIRSQQAILSAPKNRSLMCALIDASTKNGLPALLRHADRNSMRFSIESRVPFLTKNLAEFVFALPEEYLVSNKGETKSLFRASMRGIVPDEILDRRDKVGFTTPEFEWLKDFRQLDPAWLIDEPELSFMRHDIIREKINQVLLGNAPYSSQVWRWINYYRWYQLVLKPLKSL